MNLAIAICIFIYCTVTMILNLQEQSIIYSSPNKLNNFFHIYYNCECANMYKAKGDKYYA